MDELLKNGTDRGASLELNPGRRASSDMLTQNIAVVPEASEVSASELARVGAALQKQVTRDLGPVWGISATVSAFPHLEDVPVGYWPIIVTLRDLGSEAGIHMDKHGQPFALVELSPSWSLAASHECLQMLVSPYGNRTVVGTSPRADQWDVEFLVQICDPCGDARYAYTINDVLVSDFCTPMYYEPITGGQGSFTRAVESPYEVLPGGYLCWHDPISDTWWMRSHFGEELNDMHLGPIDCKVGTMREVINTLAPGRRDSTKMTIEAFEARMGVARQRALYASQYQAHRLRAAVTAVANIALPTGHRVSGLPTAGEGAFTTTLPGADVHTRGSLSPMPEPNAGPTMPPTPRGGYGAEPARRGTLPAPGLQMRVDEIPPTVQMDTTTQRLASYPSQRTARRSSPPPPLPPMPPPPMYVEPSAYAEPAFTPTITSPSSSMAPMATPSSRPGPPMTRWASGRTLFAACVLAVVFGGAGVIAYDGVTAQNAQRASEPTTAQLQAVGVGPVNGAPGTPAAQPTPTAPTTVFVVSPNGPSAAVSAVPMGSPIPGLIEGVKPSSLPLATPTPPAAAARVPGAVSQVRARTASNVVGSMTPTPAASGGSLAAASPASSAAARPAETRTDDPVDGLIGQRR